MWKLKNILWKKYSDNERKRLQLSRLVCSKRDLRLRLLCYKESKAIATESQTIHLQFLACLKHDRKELFLEW